MFYLIHELATALTSNFSVKWGQLFPSFGFLSSANITSLVTRKNLVAGLLSHENGVVVAVYAGSGAGSKHRSLLPYFTASFGVNVSAPYTNPTVVDTAPPGLFIPIRR
jgi:hypothetical protein